MRGDKWRSGVQKAAFSSSPLITSQAVGESDRRSLSLAFFQITHRKVELEKAEPALLVFYLQRKPEEQTEDLFTFHFS